MVMEARHEKEREREMIQNERISLLLHIIVIKEAKRIREVVAKHRDVQVRVSNSPRKFRFGRHRHTCNLSMVSLLSCLVFLSLKRKGDEETRCYFTLLFTSFSVRPKRDFLLHSCPEGTDKKDESPSLILFFSYIPSSVYFMIMTEVL